VDAKPPKGGEAHFIMGGENPSPLVKEEEKKKDVYAAKKRGLLG